MRLLLVISLLALSGCATKYQDMGLTGGVSAQQMTSDTYRIVARGNGSTPATMIQDYTMLKAAETTQQHGGTHFVVISAADASSSSQIVTPGYSQTTLVGNSATTTYSPSQAINIFKPGQDAYIRILTLKPGQTPPPGATSAEEVIRFVGSRVQRG
jgi:hypothetical protein